MVLERVLFGDNQFFGINHMSEDKARSQSMKFRDVASMMKVLDSAYDAGIRVFMCTTHERVADIVKIVLDNPDKYPEFTFYPCMPYAHKYANSVGEVGMLETLERFSPQGKMKTLFKGAMSAITKDVGKLAEMLIDAEMAPFKGAKTPVIFLQNVVTDLLLGAGMHDMFGTFASYVSQKYGAEPGFITMNLPKLVPVLESQGIEKPIVCANVNKIGFRMCGGIESYKEWIASGRCRPIAMSVLASGAIPPKEAFDWACELEGLESIVFGASSDSNIRSSKSIIDTHWAP
ncbi:MAG: hypothetical protein CSA62_12700 [Planctomycetota bacterium]|nr:MAG: hypothetical protein CSA62_12700 [Planctomycetota bacterium]